MTRASSAHRCLARLASPPPLSQLVSLPSTAVGLSRRAFSSSSSTNQREGPDSRSGGRTVAISLAALLSTSALLLLSTANSPLNLDSDQSSGSSGGGGPWLSFEEVAKHDSEESCWVIITDQATGKKKVWDVTDFLELHPGGEDIILANAGKDATKIFLPVHPKGIIENTLDPSCFKGFVDPATIPAHVDEKTEDEERIERARAEMPPIEALINLHDFEIEAEKVLSKAAWAYYASAGDDEFTKRENAYAYSHYWFRPRVLHKVGVPLDMSVSLLGDKIKARLPFYISPAAMARLGHPEGERNLVRGAGQEGILQGISINASCSLEEMVEVRQPGQPLLFQIYLDRNRANSLKLIQKIESMGFDGIMFTVDSATPGKRELDMRAKPVTKTKVKEEGKSQTAGKGIAHAISGYQDPNMSWEDIAWLKSLTKLPIIVKGIQCVEDVELAAQQGADAVVLSNHGGRSLDFSPAPIDVLYELRQTKPELFDKLDVFVDGGVRRGTDVLKALALGAKAVGLGRPFLYANGTYGEEGVRRMSQILEDEISISMRLMGVTRLDQLKPEMVRYMERNAAPPPPAKA